MPGRPQPSAWREEERPAGSLVRISRRRRDFGHRHCGSRSPRVAPSVQRLYFPASNSPLSSLPLLLLLPVPPLFPLAGFFFCASSALLLQRPLSLSLSAVFQAPLSSSGSRSLSSPLSPPRPGPTRSPAPQALQGRAMVEPPPRGHPVRTAASKRAPVSAAAHAAQTPPHTRGGEGDPQKSPSKCAGKQRAPPPGPPATRPHSLSGLGPPP